MANIDRIKIEIAFVEKQFFGASAALAALVGWGASHHYGESSWILFSAMSLGLGAILFCLRCYHKIYALLGELKNVK